MKFIWEKPYCLTDCCDLSEQRAKWQVSELASRQAYTPIKASNALIFNAKTLISMMQIFTLCILL